VAPISAPMPFETPETIGFIDMLLAPYGLPKTSQSPSNCW